MRITGFLKFYLILISLLFVFYSVYEVNFLTGLLIFIAATFLSPSLFREAVRVRGVKKGDTVLVSTRKTGPFGEFVQKVPARALSGGRVGDVIEVEYGRTLAKGELINCGGLIFPPEVNLLYHEDEKAAGVIR